MKNIFDINDLEKRRILESHLDATKKHYLIFEQELIKQGSSSDPWEYKKEGDKYYARKKGSLNWIKTSGNAERAIATKIFNDTIDQKTNTDSKKQENPLAKKSEELKKQKDVVEKSDTVFSTHANPDYLKQINPKKLSTSNTTTQILQPNTEDCAQFVNNFSSKLGFVGDAWLAHDVDRVGSRIFSIYTSLNDNEVKKYVNLFKKLKKGELSKNEIKKFNLELLNKYGSSKPQLKLDDVVGIYNPGSSKHLVAFENAGNPYFVNGDPNKPGKNLINNKRGFSFNTHVGIVGAIKNGVPLIFHNVHGDVRSDPPSKLNIAWVKR